MPEFIINIKDTAQFSDEERALHKEMKAYLNAIGLDYIPNSSPTNFEVVELKDSHSTKLQKEIVNKVLIPMNYRASCWDITSVFYGYYGIHRILQRHYLAINLALKALHGNEIDNIPQENEDTNKVVEKIEAPSALFLQLIDCELLNSLRSISQAGVLVYSVLQSVIEMSANHQALLWINDVWTLNHLYKRDAFKEDMDSVETKLADANVRNQTLLRSLNTSIQDKEGLERRITELKKEISELLNELRHYKDKNPSVIKQLKKAGAEVIGLFSPNGRSEKQKSYEDERTYEVINLG